MMGFVRHSPSGSTFLMGGTKLVASAGGQDWFNIYSRINHGTTAHQLYAA